MLNLSLIAPDSPRPLLREEYDRMVDLGFFEDERVELLDGMVVQMSPQGPQHAWVIMCLNALLVEGLGRRAHVRPQLPFAASDISEPEPDLMVVEPGLGPEAHPSAALLVVEVAQTSQRKDRLLKGRIYATAGVPEVWLVDLVAGTLSVLTEPDGQGYRLERRYMRGDTVAPAAFPDLVLRVEDFIPA